MSAIFFIVWAINSTNIAFLLFCFVFSALSQEGLKAEALEVLRKAAKYEPMVDKVFIPQLEEEIRLAKRRDQ